MTTTEALAAIRKSVHVDAPPQAAFETFTGGIDRWWPKATHSAFGADVREVVFEQREGGRVYERSTAGEEADWADVVVWDPPQRFVLRWRVNPERGPTEVEIRFSARDDGTLVELEHRGWDRVGDEEGRANYADGWEVVLGRYVQPAG
jgi:uncharacterized protein YndB with AHSA1/START domain